MRSAAEPLTAVDERERSLSVIENEQRTSSRVLSSRSCSLSRRRRRRYLYADSSSATRRAKVERTGGRLLDRLRDTAVKWNVSYAPVHGLTN